MCTQRKRRMWEERWDAASEATKTILRVRWRGMADQTAPAQKEVTFANAKNLYTKEETAAEEMWGDRWDADAAGVGTKTIVRVPWRGKDSK